MPIIRKKLSDFINLAKGKFYANLPTVDPSIESSASRAIVESGAIVGYSLQDGIDDAVNQAFWQTASGQFLEYVGNYDKVYRLDAQKSKGYVAVNGILSTAVPSGTPLTLLDNTYNTTQDSQVSSFSGVISMTYTGGLVTCITSTAHSLSSGLSVVISGAVQSSYNGTFTISVLDANTFTYLLTAGILTSDTGKYTSLYALLSIESSSLGQSYNSDSGSTLSINITNILSSAYVGIDGLSGGTDIEKDDSYRQRIGESHNLTPGISTESMVIMSCKKIAGNTRVYVIHGSKSGGAGTYGISGYVPKVGEVVIYPIRDNDPSIIPTNTILSDTKQQLRDDGHIPDYIDDSNYMVLSAILKTQNFVISSLLPNTVTMQNSISNQLKVFFQENADVNGTIIINSIKTFIDQIQDDITGEFIKSYTLVTPSDDITTNSGEIYTMGKVTYT